MARSVHVLACGLFAVDASVDGLAKNPVRKVVTLLQNMEKKVSAEGEREKQLFEEFNCYCKTGGQQLTDSIATNDAKVPAVQSDIESSTAEVAKLKQDLKQHTADRAASKKALAEATALREKEHADFAKEAGTMQGYKDALNKAVPAIENGMAGGAKLLQSSSAMKTAALAIKRAANSDDQLTDDDRQSVLSFLSGTSEVQESSEYVPKGGEIVGILKNMLADYEKDLTSIKATEDESQQNFEELISAKSKEIRTLGNSIEKKTARQGNLQVEIEKMKQDMTEAEAQLVQDQEMLANMGASCDTKRAEFEERVQLRSQEIVAIQDTIKILNDDDALDLFKKTLPSPEDGALMQVTSRREASREQALSVVQAMSEDVLFRHRPEVLFLELSLRNKKVDFRKVLKMIDDMVALLAEEQTDDDSKKEYCGQQLDHVEDKLKEHGKTVDDLEVSVAEKTERIAALVEEIKTLKKGISELDKLVLEQTQSRKEENSEFQELMSSNTAAKELLEFAKNRLNKFYNPSLYKAPKKKEELLTEETVFDVVGSPEDVSLLQEGSQSFDEPAPATWEGGYKKSGETSNGVVGMINELVHDLSMEMKEAEVQEQEGQKDYEEFMSESAKKRGKDGKGIAIKEAGRADAEQMKMADETTAREETQELMATTEYQGQLHKECDWLLQNFDLRKQARADEMDNLKKAKAVLSGADFSLIQAPKLAFLRRHQQ